MVASTTPQPAPIPEPTEVDVVKNAIPDFGFMQAQYLTYRVFDFNAWDAIRLCKVEPKDVAEWRDRDPEFARWEDKELPKLRKKLQVEVTLSQFYRNMWLALMLDGDVLSRAKVSGIAALTTMEQEYLMRVRARYSPENLLTMLKVATGDLSSDKANVLVQTVYINDPGAQKQIIEGTSRAV